MCDRLRDDWTRAEQFFTPFYPNTVTQYCFLRIFCYLNFTDSDKEVDKNEDSYYRLENWEIFDTVNVMYLKLYKTFGN